MYDYSWQGTSTSVSGGPSQRGWSVTYVLSLDRHPCHGTGPCRDANATAIRYDLDMGESAIDIEKLSPTERLDLIGRLWDSLRDDQVPVSDEERRLLDQRLDELDRDGPKGVSWDDVKSRWMSERKQG